MSHPVKCMWAGPTQKKKEKNNIDFNFKITIFLNRKEKNMNTLLILGIVFLFSGLSLFITSQIMIRHTEKELFELREEIRKKYGRQYDILNN